MSSSDLPSAATIMSARRQSATVIGKQTLQQLRLLPPSRQLFHVLHPPARSWNRKCYVVVDGPVIAETFLVFHRKWRVLTCDKLNEYVGSSYSWTKIYAARVSRGSSSYRSISAARARPQQQTRRPPLLLSIDGTDRRTDGRTMTDRVISE